MDYYLAHGKSLARTMRKMGYPASRECLCDWIGGPGRAAASTTARRRAYVLKHITTLMRWMRLCAEWVPDGRRRGISAIR